MLIRPINISHHTDLQLFGLVKQDNTQAFDELYRRYWPALTDAAIKRLGSKQKAEDLVQDLFVSIYNRRHTIELDISFSAYMHKALKFCVLNEIRSKMVREKYLDSLFLTDVCKIDFSNNVDSKLMYNKMQQTLNMLPEKCKTAFLLSRHESRSYKEISRQLNISISTVEKHIVKALKIMRSSLKEYQYS